MRRFSLTIVLLLCIFVLAGFKTTVQEKGYRPIAAYGIDQHLWLYQDGQDPKRVTEASSRIREDSPLDLAWSADGTRLAYRSSEGYLSVLDITDDSITNMIGFPFDILPFAFTMDSKGILFAVDGGAYGSAGPWYVNIIARDVETGLERPEGSTIVEHSSGYGADFAFYSPPTRVVGEESGWHISGSRFLEDTPFGILHSSPEGLQLDGETIWPNSYAVLSPDRRRILTHNVEVNGNSISYLDSIAILDLASQEATTVETDSEPSLLAWGGNDVIFYSSGESLRDLYEELSDEEKEKFKDKVGNELDPYWPPHLSYNQVSIHQLNLADGSEQIVYQAEAYTVGRLMPAPDGSEVYFSTIPNMDVWLENTVKSESDCNYYECIRPLFPPSLYRLDLVSGRVDLIGVGLYRATVNFGAK
jgi:hypothetical protein